jgi:hypothetical protein
MIRVGDLASIWSGFGSVSDPDEWYFGIVIETQMRRNGKRVCRVSWCNLPIDRAWYSEADISLENRPTDNPWRRN